MKRGEVKYLIISKDCEILAVCNSLSNLESTLLSDVYILDELNVYEAHTLMPKLEKVLTFA